jgi:hypothetical protein
MIPELQKVASIDNFIKKKLYFMGLLTREAEEKNLYPIVVGGSAVDFYTGGVYPSYDFDIISDRKIIGEILEKKFGFKPLGRHWINEQIGISVEVPDNHLAGDRERSKTMKIAGLRIFVIGIEDLIIDRLNACVHWKSQTDCDQAQFLVRYYMARLDLRYLEDKARSEGVFRALEKMC